MLNKIIITILIVFLSNYICTEDKPTQTTIFKKFPKGFVPEFKKGPVLDGKLDDKFWKLSTQLSPYKPNEGGIKGVSPKTDTFIASTQDALYLGFRCHEKDMAGLRGKANKLGWDDGLEIFLRVGNHPAAPYHHFIINCKGASSQQYNRLRLWKAKGLEIKAGVEDKAWILEIKIPFKDLNKTKDKKLLAGAWRFNVVRLRPPHKGDKNFGTSVKQTINGDKFVEESSWSPTETESSHLPHMFGYLFLESYKNK